MVSRKRQLQLFMLSHDEQEFSLSLEEVFKKIIFLDNNVWETVPNIVNSIDECQTGYCYIWYTPICPTLPTLQRKDGKIQGPSSGVVIQFQRCRIDDNGNLLSGRIAVGYDTTNKEFSKFVNGVWRLLNKITKVGVFHVPLFGSVDSSHLIQEFTVGKAVKDALISKEIARLKHRSTENFYLPA